jgi:hypothetical protein
MARLLRQYGVSRVYGDRVAGGYNIDEWRRCGVAYEICERTTSENYIGALSLFLCGRVRLIDVAKLRSQLVGLERHVSTIGHETVRHQANAHDDIATAICGLLMQASEERGVVGLVTPEVIAAVRAMGPRRLPSVFGRSSPYGMARQSPPLHLRTMPWSAIRR